MMIHNIASHSFLPVLRAFAATTMVSDYRINQANTLVVNAAH